MFSVALGQAPPSTPAPSLPTPAPPVVAPTEVDPLPTGESSPAPPTVGIPGLDNDPPANQTNLDDFPPAKPVQNPQREFQPPATQLGVDGDTGRSATAAASPAPRQNSTTSIQPEKPMLVDPLATTAVEQAVGNAEMLFTGLGGMPRPLTSPYLYSDLSTPGGFRRKDFTLNASVSTGANYYSAHGDQPGSSLTQFYATISPEVDLTLGEPATGRVLSVQYYGSLSLGREDHTQTPYDQNLALRGVFTLTKLTLGVGLEFSEFSGADRDFGGQSIGRQLLSLALTGTYQYSPKSSLESDLSVPVRIFERGSSSEGVVSTNFLNYNYSPLTTVGVGFAVGSLSVEDSQTQTFQQILVRITYAKSDSLAVNGEFGIEFRDAEDGEKITPIFGLGATWRIREGTTLALTSERRTFNSAADTDSNYISSNVALTATQRLGDRWTATATVGYENADYYGVNNLRRSSSSREDNYVVVQGGVVVKIGNRWSASVLGTYGNNQSNGSSVNFFHTLLQATFAY